MSKDKKSPIYGLKLGAKSHGDYDLPIRVNCDNETDLAAMVQVGTGVPGQLITTGQCIEGVFVADKVSFVPEGEDRSIDSIWCPLVIEALKNHLRSGDPDEAIFHSGKHGALTAQRVLEMLIQKDPLVLGFIEDVHGAALNVVRVRKRAPKRGL